MERITHTPPHRVYFILVYFIVYYYVVVPATSKYCQMVWLASCFHQMATLASEAKKTPTSWALLSYRFSPFFFSYLVFVSIYLLPKQAHVSIFRTGPVSHFVAQGGHRLTMTFLSRCWDDRCEL